MRVCAYVLRLAIWCGSLGGERNVTTPYEVLGISADADDEAIKIAFRQAAKKFHPDVNSGSRAAAQHFRRITAARDILSDPRQRAFYDRALKRGGLRWRILWGSCRARIITCAFMSAGAAILMLSYILSQRTPQAAAVEATIEVEKFVSPDAGSADIKALRDLRETGSWSTASAHGDKVVMVSRPASGIPASKRDSYRPTPHFQTSTTESVSEAIGVFWRRLATKIQAR
jgi:curved DNA-binding protein CbpA